MTVRVFEEKGILFFFIKNEQTIVIEKMINFTSTSPKRPLRQPRPAGLEVCRVGLNVGSQGAHIELLFVVGIDAHIDAVGDVIVGVFSLSVCI